MTGVAAIGLWLLTWAPNHQLLWTAIDSADALEHRLVPWRAIVRPAAPIWIVWSEGSRGGVSGPTGAALYLSAEDWQPFYAVTLGRSQRLLPRLKVPRLLLAEHHFRAPSGRFKRLERLAPDSAERLLHALATVHLERRLELDTDFAQQVDRRADALMAEVAGPWRRAAYTGALVEFAAHIFSISHEIGRHQRRRLERGETLCAVLEHPVSLFGSWRRAIEEGEYRGYKPAEGEEPVEGEPGLRALGRWGQTKAALGRSDKEWLLALLGVEWEADPAVDFRFLCRP